MAEINLGNVVGLLLGPTEPEKKYVIWAYTPDAANPTLVILRYWHAGLQAWRPLLEGNFFYQAPVLAIGLDTPPTAPANGARYIIGTAPTGVWAGYSDYLAEYNGVNWQYTAPALGQAVQSLAAPGVWYSYQPDGQDPEGPPAWRPMQVNPEGVEAEDIAFNGDFVWTRAGFQGLNLKTATVKEFLLAFARPDVAPVASLSVQGGAVKEAGSNNTVTLAYTVTKGTNPITAITVAGQTVTPTGDTQSGTVNVTVNAGVDTVLSMTVQARRDAGSPAQTATDSVTVQFRHYRYWFETSQDVMQLTDAAISAYLNGLTSKEFAQDRNQPARVFNLQNEYYGFAYLAAYNEAGFAVNGLPNNDQVTKTVQYTNSKGLTAAFRLYRSTAQQNTQLTVDIN